MTTMRVVGECFFWYRLTQVFPDKFHRAIKRLCVCVCWIQSSNQYRSIKCRYWCQYKYILWALSRLRDIFKFWEIIDNILEMAQDRDSYNGWLIWNRVAYQMVQLPLPLSCFSKIQVTFTVLSHCNTHNSGNMVCFNYSVLTHKLESACGLWFKIYCQRWKASWGQRQSHMLKSGNNTHIHLWPSWLCPGLPGWVGIRTNLDFTEARDSEW